MKTNELIASLHDVDEKKAGYGKWRAGEKLVQRAHFRGISGFQLQLYGRERWRAARAWAIWGRLAWEFSKVERNSWYSLAACSRFPVAS